MKKKFIFMKSYRSKFRALHCLALRSFLCCHRGEFFFIPITMSAVATLKTASSFGSWSPVRSSDAPDSPSPGKTQGPLSWLPFWFKTYFALSGRRGSCQGVRPSPALALRFNRTNRRRLRPSSRAGHALLGLLPRRTAGESLTQFT